MDPNIPIQPVQNEIPVTQSNLQQTVNKSPSPGSKWKLISLTIVLLAIVGLGLYYFLIKNKILLFQNQQKSITPTIAQLTSTPTPDPTSNWKTYTNAKYELSIKYPADTRVSQISNYTLPALNTDKNIITAIQSINPNYPRSLTGLDISESNDLANCNKNTTTKNISGIAFFVAGENIPNDAMGGMRSINDQYYVIHGNICYSIQSSVFWQDVSFDTTVKVPSSQALQEQQNWIQTQQQLNSQILSTFKFTDQNQNLTPFQKLLRQYCKPHKDVPYVYDIDVKEIPLRLEQQLTSNAPIINCVSFAKDEMENGFISYFGLNISDKMSKETYRWNSPLNISGVPLPSKNNDIKLYAYFDTNVMVRGIKMVTVNGEEISVSEDRALMYMEDPRIVKLKQDFNLSNASDKKQDDVRAIYNIFRILQQKELDEIDKLENDLSSVSALQ